MKASISVNAVTNELTITIEGSNWGTIQDLDFYQGEAGVRDLLKVAGQELTADLMRRQQVDAECLDFDGQTYYRKEASVGHYQTLYGGLAVERHLYQTSAGGETICPLEINCQMNFGSATPLLAEVIGFKLASATAGEVEQDLAKSHGLKLSDSYLREVGGRVGQIAVERCSDWQLAIPAPSAPVKTIASGVDGAMMPLVGEAYKEAMCGTIALYEQRGERLSTEYQGEMPQAGKTDFARNFAARVKQTLAFFPSALHVCLGDGAKWNWEFFGKHFPKAILILDFFHATLHLHQAAELIFGAGERAEAYYEDWRARLLEEVNGASGLLRSLIRYRKQGELTAAVGRKLDAEINYFRQNIRRMDYAVFRVLGFPIGSGVTEAACKELIKSRFCRSGMRWKRDSGAQILQLRAIKLSQQWDGFWTNVMQQAT